ncbi:MAG TPA: PAS domain S-box protein [Candidatus Binatia bacterium]|nr:PAS domain S-box protein [Candidatus Binatia bacterium]
MQGLARPRWRAYAFAVAISAATIVLRSELTSWISTDRPMLILLLLPVILAAYIGGRGPGLLATAMIVVATAYFFMPPLFEFRIERPADELQWLIMVLSGILITESNEALHRARQAAIVGEERFQLAMRGTNEGLWDWDLLTDAVHYSTRWKSMLGYGDDELENRIETWARLAHPEDRGRTIALVNGLRAGTAETLDTEFRMRHKDGHYVDIRSRGILVRNQRGTAVRLVGTHVDVSARKRAETSAARSLSLLRATLESTADGILVVDSAGRIAAYNQRFVEMWRLPISLLEAGSDQAALEDAVGQLLEPEQFLEKVRQLYLDPAASSFDLLNFKDGRVFERYSQPQRLDDTIVGRVWSFRDVTEREHAASILAASETRVRLALDAADLGTGQHDLISGIVTLDARGAAHLGFDRSTVSFAELMARVHPDDLERVTHEVGTALQATSGEPRYVTEHRVIHPDGTVHWLAVQALVHFEGEGGARRAVSSVGTTRDITRRMLALDELRRRENHLQVVTNAVPALIAYVNGDYRIRSINRTSEFWFGVPPELLIGRDVRTLLGKVVWARIGPKVEGALAGDVMAFEEQTRFPTGLARWVHITYRPDRDDSGRVRGFVALVTDITETKRVQEELQLSHAQLVSALEASGMGTWVWEIARNNVWWDDASARIWGRILDEVDDRSVERMLALVAPEDHPQVVAAIERIARGDSDEVEMDFRISRPDGMRRWVMCKGRLERDAAGHPWRIAGISADVTDRKHAEEAQLRSQKLEALGTLAGGIAHDFNNILLAITGNTKLAIADVAPDHPAQKSLTEIAKASARAVDLVRSILTFSRAGDQGHDAIKLDGVIDEALTLLRTGLPPTIEIRTAIDPTAPAVGADATQMHQVVVNLVTNAAHAIGSRRGVIELRLDATEIADQPADGAADLRPGRYVRLCVSDNGCGMDRATVERIFDPFFTTKSVGEGTGLGLSFVHGIVKSHGGAITVDSQVGAGSKFTVCVPAIAGAIGNGPAPSRPAAPGHGERILYIDDDEALVLLIERLLTPLGYRVTGHCDAAAALREFQRHPSDFDAVVTDLAMPGMSGFDLARAVQSLRADIPIVVTSGFVRPEDEVAARQLGIRDVVLKPDTVEELGRALDQLFRVPTSLAPNHAQPTARSIEDS